MTSASSPTPAPGPGLVAAAGLGAAAAAERGAGVVARQPDFGELNASRVGPALGSLDNLLDVSVTVTCELGRVTRPIGEVLKYGIGAVVELERALSEPVDLLVQGVRVARGEVVVLDDRFAVRITEIADPKRRSER